MRGLLEGDAYIYLNCNDATLIRACQLYEARCLLEEMQYFYSQVELFNKKLKIANSISGTAFLGTAALGSETFLSCICFLTKNAINNFFDKDISIRYDYR